MGFWKTVGAVVVGSMVSVIVGGVVGSIIKKATAPKA